MNFIGKTAVVTLILFLTIQIDASEVSKVISRHLTPDTTNIVTSYAYAGTITLDSYNIVGIPHEVDWQLTEKEQNNLKMCYQEQLKKEPFVPVTYTFYNTDLTTLQKIRLAILPRALPLPLFEKNTYKVGDTVRVQNFLGNEFDFELCEDRARAIHNVIRHCANLYTLFTSKGYVGSHNQVLRYMKNQQCRGYERGKLTPTFNKNYLDISRKYENGTALLLPHEQLFLEILERDIDKIVNEKS